MTPKPLPYNLDPSQCYRLLDPDRDTLQARDQVLVMLGHDGWKWELVHVSRHGESPCVNHIYRRPFTPPAPVQVQEFWRLLEVGKDRIELGDEFTQSHEYEQARWQPFSGSQIGKPYTSIHCTARRRVTVPVADAPKAEPVTESGPFLVSVDGYGAPTCEHATIEDARTEAERLARQEHPAQVRLLRQVAVAKAEMTVKWEGQNI